MTSDYNVLPCIDCLCLGICKSLIISENRIFKLVHECTLASLYVNNSDFSTSFDRFITLNYFLKTNYKEAGEHVLKSSL